MKSFASFAFAILIVGCGSSSDPPGADAPPPADDDGDTYSVAAGDCNDNNPAIHPGAPDPCDALDNNCDGSIDEAYDLDHDNISVCQGDCADNDPDSRPGAPEMLDGIDNDCDMIVDNHLPSYDDDGDGYAEDQGDCDDEQEFVNPGALEVQTREDGTAEGIDNDCDTLIDEPADPCPDAPDQNDPSSYANALDVCHELRSAAFEAPTEPAAREIRVRYGDHYVPQAGPTMIAISSGTVADEADPDFVVLDSGTQFNNTHPHPSPGAPIGCGGSPDPAIVNDYSEVTLELQVPTNAQSFSFDFNFMSVEYPEWVCDIYNDSFIAYLESGAFTGNISFDSMDHPVSVNNAFLTVCSDAPTCTGDADLAGTGYEGGQGGGTGWLTTTAPVIPGEKIKIRFAIFDEGDWILDSAVLIDNFRWHLEAVDAPVTEG